MNKTKKLKVLTTNVLHIGDFILTTSAIAILKKEYPDTEITVIAPKAVKELAENNPVIDRVIYCTYPEYNTKSQIKRLLWNIINWPRLFFKRYDLCLILDSSRLSILMSKFLFVKTAGIDKNFYGVNVSPEMRKYYGTVHNINRSQTIVRSHFGIYNNALPVIADFSKMKNKVSAFIKNPGKKNIALCLRGAGDKRGASSNYGTHSEWDIENFIKTVNLLSSERNDLDFYIVGTKNDADYAEKLVNSAIAENVTNLCGKTSLLELTAFISCVDLLISVDTGTTHCAALTKTPIIVLCPHKDYIAPVTPRLVEMSAKELSFLEHEAVCSAALKLLNISKNDILF